MNAKQARHVLPALALLAALAGCEDDGPTGNGTTISGNVVDPDRIGIYDVHVAVVYFEDLLSGAVAPVAADEPALLAPYPNPTFGLDGSVVNLQMTTPVDTTAKLEIWSDVFGPYSRIRGIHDGPVAAGTTSWTWDHTDAAGDPLPNGMYRARLTVPASGDSVSVQERGILLTRPAASISRRPEYNAFTDPEGRFSLENLPIGGTFTLTNSGGQVLGTGIVRNRVDLVFREPDYRERILPVTTAPGAALQVADVIMEPLFPSRTPPERSTPWTGTKAAPAAP